MKLPFTNVPSPIRPPLAFTALRKTNFAPHFEFVPNFVSDSPNPQFTKRLHFITIRFSKNDCPNTTTHFSPIRRSNPLNDSFIGANENRNQWNLEIRNPVTPPIVSSWASMFNIRDHAFLLLAIMGSATSMAFISFLVASVSALCVNSLTLIDFLLINLLQELIEGVTKSGQVIQASEAGAKQIGAVAYRHSIPKRNEMANLPCISLQPVLSGVGKRTSRAVIRATRDPTL